MPGTPTPNLGLTVPTVGADVGTWGAELNGDLAILDGLAAAQVINTSTNLVAVVGVCPNTLIRVTTGALALVFALLPPAQCSGRSWTIKKVDAGAGSVSVVVSGGALIDGYTSWLRANQNAYVTVTSNGVGYDVIANN